jgi:hypothetical protein
MAASRQHTPEELATMREIAEKLDAEYTTARDIRWNAPPAVPSQLFSELAKLFLATEASPLRIANVEFWSDAVGPFADTLSFSVPTDKWDARAMGESVAQLARVYPEVSKIVARYASPNWYGVQSDMRSQPPTE